MCGQTTDSFLSLIRYSIIDSVSDHLFLSDQDDLVFGFAFDFRLHKLAFSYERSRATRNTVFAGGVFAWVFLRIAWVFLRISCKQKHSLLQRKIYPYIQSEYVKLNTPA